MTGLVPSWTWGDVVLSEAPFSFLFGSDFGAPQTATEALAQLLQDGEVEVGTRASNRTLEFTIGVESTDLLESAEAERLLALEAAKARNTLTFDPGDGFAPATVYETFRAQVTFVRSDDGEMAGFRQYEITMKASPFGRSADEVITEAQSASVTPPTTIDPGDSTTNWTARRTLTDSGAYLTAADPGSFLAATTYTPPVPIDLSATRYVSLVMWGFSGLPSLLINGSITPLPLVGSEPSTTPGRTRYIWRVPAATTVSKFAFGTGTLSFNFNLLQRTDAPPAIGTTRQKMRSVEVAGSARTQGSLAVQHETSALGSTMVYTWPAVLSPSYMPALRGLRVSGGSTTTDITLVSGARDTLDTALVYDVPVAALIEGTHLLMARLRSDTNGDQSVTWSAQLRQGSTNIGTAMSGTRVVPFSTTPTTWRNVVLGRMVLPPVGVPDGSTAVVRVTIVAASSGASDIDLDESWLFNTSVGDLSWVECGTAAPSAGGSSNRLWLDTASVALPRPRIFRGYSEDRSDAFHPGSSVLSFGVHSMEPPLMNVFSVTSNAEDAAVSLEHFPRWHTHAAI